MTIFLQTRIYLKQLADHNCKLRVAVSHEKLDAKGLYYLKTRFVFLNSLPLLWFCHVSNEETNWNLNTAMVIPGSWCKYYLFYICILCTVMRRKIVTFCLLSFFRPVNFLHSFSYSNRFTIAATFGATASTCVGLFLFSFGEFASSSVSVWLKGEKMILFIQNIIYFTTCLSRSKWSSRPHNIFLFLASFRIQAEFHSHGYSSYSVCHP